MDYVFNQTDHQNLILVFETSPTESLQYDLNSKPFEGKNGQVWLRLTKDTDHGINPTINGLDNHLLVESLRDISIIIHSIDLNQVQLFQIDNYYGEESIRVEITNANIHFKQIVNSLKTFFIYFFGKADKLSIKFYKCLLISKPEDLSTISQHFWLSIPSFLDERAVIDITETRILGGIFKIWNVATVNISNCLMQHFKSQQELNNFLAFPNRAFIYKTSVRTERNQTLKHSKLYH